MNGRVALQLRRGASEMTVAMQDWHRDGKTIRNNPGSFKAVLKKMKFGHRLERTKLPAKKKRKGSDA